MSKKRKGTPAKYCQRNWSRYNKGMVKRGKIIFMIATDIGNKWLVDPTGYNLPEGQPLFTDFVIESFRFVRLLSSLYVRQKVL